VHIQTTTCHFDIRISILRTIENDGWQKDDKKDGGGKTPQIFRHILVGQSFGHEVQYNASHNAHQNDQGGFR